MNTNKNLKELTINNMSDVINKHNLKLIEVSDNEVLLKSPEYAINIAAEKDGVSIIYFDTSSTPTKGYNIFLFLVNQRRSSLVFSKTKPCQKDYAEFIESELNSLTQHIRNAGQDILDGSKDWIKSYHWKTITPSKNIASMI